MSRLGKRLTVAVAVVATLSGAAAPVGAQPARVEKTPTAADLAPNGLNDCPTGYVCLWTGTDYTGSRWQGKNGDNDLFPDFIMNKSLSSYNNSGRTTCLWRGYYYSDEVMREAPGSRRANLALDLRPSGGNWAREFSSQNWC